MQANPPANQATDAARLARLDSLRAIRELNLALARAAALEDAYEAALTALQQALQVDRASILLFDPDGVMRFKAWRGLSETYRGATVGHSPWPTEAVDPRPLLVSDVTRDRAVEDLRELLLAERIRALAFVPLLYRGRLLGKFMLYYEAPHAFSDEEVLVAQTIAGHIAFALEQWRVETEHERLLERELAARQAAERSTERIARLQRITAALSEALTPAQVARTIGEQARAVLRADSVMIGQVSEDGRELEIIGAAGPVAERLAGWERFSLDSRVPLVDAVRTGTPIWPESSPERIARYPQLQNVYAGQPRLTWFSVPLLAHGRPIGGMSLSFARAPALEEADRELVFALAQQCAQALDRARLYEAEQRARTEAEAARARLAFLAETSSELASSLGDAALVQRVAELAVPDLADWCIVDLLEPDGSIQRVATAHADPRKIELLEELRRKYPTDPRTPHGYPEVIRTGRAELIETVTEKFAADVTQNAEHLALVCALGFRSTVCVPLTARGQILGAVTLIISESERRFSQAELPLVEEFARRAAVALDNTRLYREAQEAIRVRDEFLSVAAHELRTPLTTLTGHAQLLRRRLARTASLDRAESARSIESIERQASRLARLIAQLLDISRIQAGQLALERQPTDLTPLIGRIATDAGAWTSQHEIRLELPERLEARVDPLRLEQVLANLLENAIKYSPDGGPIDVVASLDSASEVKIAVRDRGIGIPPERRLNLFERFHQAHPDGYRSGMGLGLYVSRQIVELHGGQISAEFPEDGGTRMVIRLPAGEKSGPPASSV